MTSTTRAFGHLPLPAYHRPFLRYIDPPADGAAPPAAPPAGDPPAAAPPSPPAPTPPPAPAPPAPPATPPAPVNYRGNPDEYVHELREEAKGHRVSFETEQTAHTATKTELATAAAERDSLRRENALLLAAPKLGARADLLLDSSSFMKTFADVDLANEEAVKKAIEDALGKNPTFKAGPTLPGASGTGPQGGQPPTTTPTLESAIKARVGG